jgi:hypothetical protein
LQAEWKRLIAEEEKKALPGLWNSWVTFGNLSAEIAGIVPPYLAGERITTAATDRWRDPYIRRRIDPQEEIDDASSMARTLKTFEDVVTRIAQAAEVESDPSAIREWIMAN